MIAFIRIIICPPCPICLRALSELFACLVLVLQHGWLLVGLCWLARTSACARVPPCVVSSSSSPVCLVCWLCLGLAVPVVYVPSCNSVCSQGAVVLLLYVLAKVDGIRPWLDTVRLRLLPQPPITGQPPVCSLVG